MILMAYEVYQPTHQDQQPSPHQLLPGQHTTKHNFTHSQEIHVLFEKKTENDQQLNHMRCFGCSNIQNKIFFTKEFDPW